MALNDPSALGAIMALEARYKKCYGIWCGWFSRWKEHG